MTEKVPTIECKPDDPQDTEYTFARQRVCKSCFMREEIATKTLDEEFNPLCDYCLEHTPQGPKLLERMLDILNTSLVSDLPHVIRLMYEVLKEKKDE